MKVLFIGGTGNISTSVSKLAIERGIDLHLFTRGQSEAQIPGATMIAGDISDKGAVASILAQQHWDAVVDWIAFVEDQVQRDIDLFHSKTKQYIFISSASVYQKPLSHPVVGESTPLANPFWEYSRNKIACEERLIAAYRRDGFPVTIVRPSHTYDTQLPTSVGGGDEYTVADRLIKGKKIIIHGDGTSLWTLTHSEDFAKGFLGLLGHQQAIGQAFHITSDELLTWNQIYAAIAEALQVEMHAVHIASDFICRFDETKVGELLGDKATSVIFDNSKIKRFVPEYRSTIPFQQGIRRTLAWFDAKPERKLVRPATNRIMDDIITAYEKR